jgi:preprotein translocase subunit Sec61beta
MRAIRIPGALFVVLGLVVLTAWIMGWSVQRAVFLAPVIVVGFAAVAGLLILWGKVALQAIRDSPRPRLVVGLWLAGLVLLALLTLLGVELPREG